MAMQFEYDEEGGTFFYFLLSFWALLLLPATYYLWPRKKSKDEEERLKKICQCIPCQVKRQRLNVNHTWIKTRDKVIKIGLIIGWVIFILLAYKVSKIQLEHVEYDPYAELEIDRGASQSEIKKAYRKLSLTFHPDKETGDEKKFMRIAKAYAALTDEETKKNWEEYGNPDGPGVTKFGIALPKWIIEEGNSVWVLAVYGVIFMVILPVVVGIWWYRSIKFSKDQVLLDTTRLYYYFFQKVPNMTLKKVIMVLAASFEFDKQHNSLIVERPSDNEEVPPLMKMLPDLDEKNKEKPLCYTYSVKARALLHSQFNRIELPRNTLELDRLYILKKCPVLINEMINMISQLVASAVARRAMQYMPRLDTVENVMKVSPMIIQGVTAKCSPLLQLPHITQDMLRHFVTKKRNVQKIRDLVTMKAADRRMLLRTLNDEEYQHVMNACHNLPQVKMIVKSEVLDDEDTSITAGSIVTVTVTLERKSMGEVFEKELKEHEEHGSYSNQRYIEMHEEDEEHGMNEGNDKNEEKEEDEEAKNEETADTAPKKTSKAWEKNKKHKKKGGKAAKKKPKQPYQWKKTQPVNDKKPSEETPDQAEVSAGDSEHVDQSGSEHEEEPEEENQSEVEEVKEIESSDTKEKQKKDGSKEEEEDDWDKFQEEAKKENVLTPKKKESHPVHCPYFPEEKQEGWWLYVADRKNHMLISAPVQILSLKTSEEIQLKFSAPLKPGLYTYSVILRSDCYFDFDQVHNIKLDVKEHKAIKEHPQWDISSDEEENQDNNDDDGTDSDYSTDNEDSD
ncbi:hypothetical protein ACJMK2_028087 [Sinanodonta woodiana]|uniref:J domain-containing protein n=1 Tax=Sinanodonta woodiana TaxID=1069815 RepID=A0ABD3X6J7_SINWO